MLTAITGETLREGMEIVSTAQILNRSGNSGGRSFRLRRRGKSVRAQDAAAPQAEHGQHEGSLRLRQRRPAPASLIRGNASIHPLNHSFLPLQALQQRDPLT